MAQMQLLQIPLNEKDVVYTQDWAARDMVEFFKPSGRILDPSKGDGVFLKHLPPNTAWCEIENGKDFFAWNDPVDWVFGNPPYSIFTKWMEHSMKIADNICYLIPCNKPFNSYILLEQVMKWGGIAHMRVYGRSRVFNIDIGFSIGAVHFKKDYAGAMYFSKPALPSNIACSGRGTAPRR